MAILMPAVLPLGVTLSRISHSRSDNGENTIVPKKNRGRALVDKMIKGGASAPITEWSEAKLEKAIRRNSLFRDHADELRLARVNALVAQGRSSTAPVTAGDVGAKASEEIDRQHQDSNVPDTLCQADLLLLAAEGESQANPARDAALELLADNSFDALLITDAEGAIVYSNKAFTKLTGYDQADVIGKSPKLLQGPGTDKKVLNRLKKSLQNGDGDYEGSTINYKKNGTPFIMHWRCVPVKVGGEIKAWVAIQREGSTAE